MIIDTYNSNLQASKILLSNMSNSMECAVHVEANLQEQLRNYLQFLTLKMRVRVTEYHFHNGSIRRQISTSIKARFEILAPALTISEILTLKY